MKRILTIQDISCLGRCSITVSLPVLSAMGIETSILPTALLSTHTMFESPFRMDLSEQMQAITAHWKKENIHFDAIYTGYLGTEEEIALTQQVIRDFRSEDTIVFVDPVMGDHGRLYAGFSSSYAEKNRSLCAMADMIVPNITEACLMTGIEYRENYDEKYIKELMAKMRAVLLDTSGSTDICQENLSPSSQIVAITGVSLSPGQIGAAGLDSSDDEYYICQTEQLPAVYHGTGDIFSSVTAGSLLQGLSWQEALQKAARFTACTIRASMEEQADPRFGVAFEKVLGQEL